MELLIKCVAKSKTGSSDPTKMIPKTEIINHKIVNWVEQLACFLKEGDTFRKPRSSTQYKFEELLLEQRLVICKNTDTLLSEKIYCNSPVFKLVTL